MKFNLSRRICFIAVLIIIYCTFPFSAARGDATEWIEVGPEGGGKLQAFAFDPAIINRVYLTSFAGVFVSDDAGESWHWSSYGATLDIQGIAVDTSDAKLLYISGPEGIYRSTDRAGHWKMVYSKGNKYKGINNETFGARVHIAEASILGESISVSQNGIIYVCTKVGDILISRDRGDRWEQVSTGGSSEVKAVIPVANDNVVAALSDDGIYLSKDQGMVWEKVLMSKGQEILALSIHPVAKTLYVLAGKLSDIQYFPGYSIESFPAFLYRSDDGGETWEMIHTFDKLAMQDGRRKMDVSREGTIIILSDYGPIRSENGGSKWTSSKIIGEQNDRFIYEKLKGALDNTHTVYADLHKQGRWYMTNMLAAFRSDDDGKTWHYKVKGLRENGFWLIRVNPQNADIIIASQQDHGMILSSDGGRNWRDIVVDNPYEYCDEIKFSPNDDGYRTLYAFCSFQDTFIAKSEDAGETWAIIKRWKNKERRYMGRLCLVKGAQVPVMFVSEPRVGIWRSLDEGRNWELKNKGIGNPEKIMEVKFIESDKRGIVYAGILSHHDGGNGIFKSIDNGESWVTINRGLRNLDIRRRCFEIDPNHPDILWVGSSRDVYRSTNGGNDWEVRIAGIFCSSILIEPDNSDNVYVASFNGGGTVEQFTAGIFKSVDGGNYFFNISGNLTRTIGSSYRVYDLEYGWKGKGHIWAAPLGGGLVYTIP